MDELDAVLEARRFLASIKTPHFPMPSAVLAEAASAVLSYGTDFPPGESGFSFPADGKWYINLNANERPARQRFTLCHEIAHIVLGLPSDHARISPSGKLTGKSPNELLCDRFASEVLLPHAVLKPLVEKAEIGIPALRELAAHFDASLTSTGMAFVTVASAPCALVLAEGGKVRYSVRSTSLRQAGAWIPPGHPLPENSVSAHVRTSEVSEGPEPIKPERWFATWKRDGDLLEDAVYLAEWDQTLTLLWFEDEELPPIAERDRPDSNRDDESEDALQPLDGILRWKKR